MLKQFKKPDLNAPRFRPKVTRLMTDDFFSRFREKHPEFADVPNDQLKQLIKKFNENLWGTVIENRDGIELAEGLGYVFMGTCKPSKKPVVDYGKSIKAGDRVRARNWESDNHLMKIFYSNYASKYRFEHYQLWQFKACRDFSRAASAAYRKDWKKYIEVENNRMISSLFKASIVREKVLERSDTVPSDYNEFQFD
jgi:hypothetical protein